jgi:hypothetical protein
MTIAKNDAVAEMLLADGRAYYTIFADRWECPACKNAILTGFAKFPIAEHYEGTRESSANQYHFAADFPREERYLRSETGRDRS